MIPAQRFNFLDSDTNLPVSEFQAPQSSSIFNTLNNHLSEIDADVEEFIKNTSQLAKEELDALKGAIEDAVSTKPLAQSLSSAKESLDDVGVTRGTKSLFGAVKDLKKLTPRALDDVIAKTLPNNPVVQSAFRTLSSRCKGNAFGRGGLGKPFDASINCGAGNRKAGGNGCDTSSFNNLLNKLTGGQYNAAYSDMNQVLNNLMALSMYGYKMNMCGVFGALAQGVESSGLLSRAAGGLMNALSEDKNMMGILDLASATAGLTPLLENPGGIGKILSNFEIPSEIKNSALGDFSKRFTGALSLFSDSWGTSLADQVPSVADFGDNYSPDLSALLDADVKNNIYGVDELDRVPFRNEDYLATAYSFAQDGIVF